jgi:hypothetical protein
MAKIVEEIIVIKFSKIVKDSDSESSQITERDLQKTIEDVVQELVSPGVLVEVERV